MIPGTILDAVAWGAAGAAIASAAATVPALRNAATPSRLAAGLLAASTAACVALLLFLATRFLAADISYQYVFFYTARDVEWPWRLAGTWAGREGSLLLWTAWLAATTMGVTLLHQMRRAADEAEDRGRAWMRFILALFVALFLAAVATQSAFLPTGENLLAGRPDGNGLNPTLKSGYILIHPPMMFAAYALSAVPLAAALGHLASGTERWSRVALPWGRLGWLLMTFSLGLGALWAYYTLGFGGYWAWDPVEVANLLPWLAFTIYLHAQLHHARHGSYRSLGPFLAALPFLLTLFSTISTRSGLWVSVHAFTDPTDTFNPDAAARFLDILAVEPSLSFHVGLFVATFATLLALWCRRLALDHDRLHRTSRIVSALFAAFAGYALLAPASAFSLLLEAAWQITGGASPGLGLLGITMLACLLAALPMLVGNDEAEQKLQGAHPAKRKSSRAWLERIDVRSLAAYSVLALGMALLILFLFHVAAAQGGSTARFYEERFPFLALPILLGLIVFQAHQAVGRRRSLQLAGAALAFGLAAYWVARNAGQFRLSHGLLLAVPALVLVAVGFVRLRRAGTPPNTPRNVRRADTLLVMASLLNVVFWLNPPTVRLGFWSWTPVWPMQAIFGAVALLALAGAVRTLVGVPPRRLAALHVLVGALGGFYLAPVLALASWMLRRNHAPERPQHDFDVRARARLQQVALHGVHFAIAIALLGYAPSTYLKSQADLEFDSGQAHEVAGFNVTFVSSRMEPAGNAPATTVWQDFAIRQSNAPPDMAFAQLHWEENAGAHYPLPTTMRTWTGDLYLHVSAVHVAAGSPCLGTSHPDGAWVEAYRAGSPSRICGADRIDGVRATVAHLPGLGLLWLALALGVAAMAALMWAQPVVPVSRTTAPTTE